MSVLVILLIACAIPEFLREWDRLEREWHALGARTSPAGGVSRWTDFNL